MVHFVHFVVARQKSKTMTVLDLSRLDPSRVDTSGLTSS